MNRNVLIAIIIVIIIAIVGAFALAQQGSGEKIDTKISYLDENATFQNGDQLHFELKDADGNAIAGEQLYITYKNNENQAYTAVTDSNGQYALTLENMPAGDDVVIVKYAGNDKYNDYELQKTITVE